MNKKELVYFNSRLYQYSDKLTASDNIIAHYIVNNPEKVTRMKIKDLTNKLYISKASLVRFCQKLQYDGFIDLKNQLKVELLEEMEKNSMGSKDSSFTPYEQLITNHKKLLDRFIQFVKRDDLEELISDIKSHKKVMIYGSSDLSLISKELANTLRKTGVPIEYFSTVYELTTALEYAGEGTMLIFLTYKCSESYLANIFKKIKNKGVFLSLITSYPNATFKNLSDKCLVLPNLIHLDNRNNISTSFVLIILINLLSIILDSE